MQIFITGGTGLIGRALCQELLARNHQLTVLSRRPERVASLCGASVTAINSLTRWQPEHYDAVINLAGEPIADARWSAARKQLLWQSRVTLTQQLVERMRQADKAPSILLSGSAIGYYGNTGNHYLDEGCPAGHDFAAELCQAWEQTAQQATDLGVRVCLLRTGLVLSAQGGLLAKLRLPFQLGLGAQLGDGQQFMSWVHLQDHVAMLLQLLEQSSAQGAYNLTAPEPVTNRDFTAALGKALHRPTLLTAPKPVLKLLLGERAVLMLEGQRVLPKRLQDLGYRFAYPTLDLSLQAVN